MFANGSAWHKKAQNNNTDEIKGMAAHMSEMKKKRDYGEKSKQNDLHFMPLAVETYGRWGKDLTLFFETNVLAGWRNSGQTIPLAVIKEYWK
mgnify:CR=1 FL=1